MNNSNRRRSDGTRPLSRLPLNWDHPVGLVVLAVALGLWGWLIGGLRNGPKSTTVRSEDTDPSPNDYLTGEAPERVLLDQRKGGAHSRPVAGRN